jgi:hypothetical protein
VATNATVAPRAVADAESGGAGMAAVSLTRR